MLITNDALLTDLYELFMVQSYLEEGLGQTAVFELFVRRLPACRNFLVAAGLDQALDFLENLSFRPDELEWLRSRAEFSSAFIDELSRFRFTGDVNALPEGSVFFPNEPIMQVIAPIAQAQLVETRLMNLVHFQTVIASKAARMTLAAQGRELIDFGFRRAHGAEAGMLVARASYLAGFAGTSTVAAGRVFGIPIFGTMAHSYIQAHDTEREAFERFALGHPAQIALLIDTYDTEAAAGTVVSLAPEFARRGLVVRSVRLDSGDLAAHAHAVRGILDHGGLKDVRILASGNLDEMEIGRLLARRAPIDAFGVGTALSTSSDAAHLDCAYKLQEFSGRPRRKRSEGKATWPGRKQIYRRRDTAGRIQSDTLALFDEDAAGEGEPLLRPVMRGGKKLLAETLDAVRRRCLGELNSLSLSMRALGLTSPYTVTPSEALRRLTAEFDKIRP